MKRINPLFIGLTTIITLAACTPTDTPPDDNQNTSAPSSSMEETNNVLYRGTLEEIGVSVFMQGTHKLTLDDGRFILLESNDVSLDTYLGMRVEVFGSVRPTVEEGGMIMRVESVKSLEASSASAAASSESLDSSDSSASSIASIASDSSIAPSSAAAASSQAAVTSAAASSVAAWESSDELTVKAQTMAKDKMGPENWTQTYCSSHIGYCIPVHRNWWFNSFGATSSSVWHVEIGPSEMNNLGEGPLTVRLVPGDVSATGMTDGQVSASDGGIMGVRSWTGGRHFEIRGPAMLEPAIRYITEQLKPSNS